MDWPTKNKKSADARQTRFSRAAEQLPRALRYIDPFIAERRRQVGAALRWYPDPTEAIFRGWQRWCVGPPQRWLAGIKIHDDEACARAEWASLPPDRKGLGMILTLASNNGFHGET